MARCSSVERATNCCAALSHLYERCANGVEIAWPDGPITPRVRRANRLLLKLLRAATALWWIGLAADRQTMLVWRANWKNYRDELGWDFPETRAERVALDTERMEQLAFEIAPVSERAAESPLNASLRVESAENDLRATPGFFGGVPGEFGVVA